jgi:hypothetical protein
MFKVGDRVVCKYVDNDVYINRNLKLNEIYTITRVSSLVIFIDKLAFKKESKNGHYNFDDYFMYLKDYRKQKLNKIDKYGMGK